MTAGDVEVNRTGVNFRKCAVFDGVDDKITFTDDGKAKDDPVSFSVWIKLSSDGSASATSNPIMGSDYLRLYVRETTNVVKLRYDYGSAVEASKTLGNGDRLWHHIVGTFALEGADYTIRLYVDGVLEDTTTNSNQPGTDYSGSIGVSGSGFFGGAISDVKIFDKKLSQNEVDKLYRGIEVTDGLTHRWMLQSDYTDSVGSADGTNTGTYLTGVDDAVASAISTDRTTANDHYMLTGVGKQKREIISAIVEEA